MVTFQGYHAPGAANRETESLPTCVLVGLHQNGLGVARALGRHGVPVVAVDELQNDAWGMTRYARRIGCPDLRGTGLIDTLCDIGKGLSAPGVLVLTLDRSVLLVSQHRARLERYFIHSLPADSVIQRLMNKSETERFARVHGFEVPRTYRIRHEDDLDRCIAEIDLPCILKPEVKTVEFVQHSPKKAFFIKSVDELRATWNQVVQWEPAVVVQEWIPGPETKLVFCLFYFDETGRPLTSFGGRKIRQFIPHCGTACSAEPWDDPIAYDEGVRFFQAAGYRGFGAIEFKVAPDGRYFLIEPTVGRTEHIFALAAANGVNLTYVGYRHMAGLSAVSASRRRRKVIYLDWKRDYRAATALVSEGELTWPGWIKSIARPRQHALFAWDDPAPWARLVRERAARVSRRAGNRLKRSLTIRVHRVAAAARDERRSRELGAATRPLANPGDLRTHITAAVDWICAAQDAGGAGVARAYSWSPLSHYPVGWQPPYPETTGYIIPTMFDCAARLGRPELAHRARRMADWELSLQQPAGSFPGGTTDRHPMPVVFNTGMVLLGLTRAYSETGSARYRDAIIRAADFLVSVQSKDGAWRRFANIDGSLDVHAYDCLVGWGLVAAAQLCGEERWSNAAVRNLDFTLTLQSPNGWFSHNALRPKRVKTPLTHTIAYATAGLLEAGVLLAAPRFIAAAERTAQAVSDVVGDDGFLAGEFDNQWRPKVDWSCLTGTAQMAVVWWRLFELRRDPRFAEAARRATAYLRCRHEVSVGGPGTRGGVAGSFPIEGRYGRYQFLNWAAKFFVDAMLLEERVASTRSEATLVLAHASLEAGT